VASIAEFLESIQRQAELRRTLRHHEILGARPAELAARPPPGFESMKPLLERSGIGALYSHQRRALEHLAEGDDVVLATPTASGKTLVYNLPVLERALADPDVRALYLFPLKALERDQRERLEQDIAALGSRARPPTVEIYDGDTPTARRRRIRDAPPNVLITTPDMLHFGILPRHATWRAFFEGLRTVVVDELHAYRGIFGSHVAQILRRLQRVAAFHGARPQFVAASATIANPGELARALTGRDFQVIETDGSPRTERHVLLLNPEGSPYTLAARLFRVAVGLGLRTIAFTKARVITELMHTWIIEAEPALRDRISSYRSGFLPEERRDIEQRLFSGDLLGVISTSALEMGIDVGGLDVCLLVGYPGSQMATWQRAGRVGRAREALIALVAQPDALDQYLVSHPRVFFERPVEHAVLDPHNPEVAAAHLPCAAVEVPLRSDEEWLAVPSLQVARSRLEESGDLLRSESGHEWFASRRAPHRDVDLRAAGSSYTITLDEGDAQKPTVIGSIGAARVFSECHDGAIYLHRGRQFLVTRLDPSEHVVRVRAVDSPFYTRAVSEKETEVLERQRTRPAGNFRLVQGRLRVTTRITGFERRRVRGQDLIGTEPLDLPPSSFDTVGVWIELPDEIPADVTEAGFHHMGGIHALEHAALSMFPLFSLCDRHDVAGISYRRHPQVGHSAVFFYDGHAGGTGIVSSLFDRFESLLDATLELIQDCPCEEGCPACVHSPKCGSGNRPIDKTAAVRVLRLLLGREPLRAQELRAPAAMEPDGDRGGEAAFGESPQRRLLFFDLETQRSAEEVGGWHNAHLMRLALAVVYDSVDARFETYRENEVEALLARLRQADLVVGFNIRRFDYAVLRGYTDADVAGLPTFDLLEAVHSRLGFRLPLSHLAEETLGVPKSGDGLQSLKWWKDGRVDDVEQYCRKDVALVRDLFEHALRHEHLLFRTRSGERVRLPARWSVDELIEREQARATPTTRPARAGVS
jgi:DEAD/DEAH box helicase domain-containing protein